MNKHDINRILVHSSYGVGDSFDSCHWLIKLFIRTTNFKVVFRDHQATEKLLRGSRVIWNMVKPTMLTDATELKTLEIDDNKKLPLSASISRKHVAKFMLDNLETNKYVGKTPIIWEK